jgi:hypothetical protein
MPMNTAPHSADMRTSWPIWRSVIAHHPIQCLLPKSPAPAHPPSYRSQAADTLSDNSDTRLPHGTSMSTRAINVAILLRRVRKLVAVWCIARHEPTDQQRERLVHKLEGYRRIATHYEKRAVHYLRILASLVVIVPIERTGPHSAFARMSASQQGITLSAGCSRSNGRDSSGRTGS